MRRGILVIPEIRKNEISILKIRQVEVRSALCSLNVNKVSQIFFMIFQLCKIRLIRITKRTLGARPRIAGWGCCSVVVDSVVVEVVDFVAFE